MRRVGAAAQVRSSASLVGRICRSVNSLGARCPRRAFLRMAGEGTRTPSVGHCQSADAPISSAVKMSVYNAAPHSKYPKTP